MYLQKLDIHGLRNLNNVQLTLSPGVNFFYGQNGSGKTSLLEAIHLLGRGRSFRSRTLSSVIDQNKQQCTVFGLLGDEREAEQQASSVSSGIPLGVSRSRQGDFQFKLNGSLVSNASSLAEALPLLLLTSETFNLMSGGPRYRRQYIDWGVFHVEQRSRIVGQAFRRALKQRNSLLRHGRIDQSLLTAWDAEFVQQAEQINTFRQQYLVKLLPKIKWVLQELSPLEGFGLKYYPGWDATRSLAEVLLLNRRRDQQLKTTGQGPHRADLRVNIHKQQASEILSRGQLKMLVMAMQLAQGFLFHELTGKHCLYLLDDLSAELDLAHRKKAGELLKKLKAQVFITGVMKEDVVSSWPKGEQQSAMFHVEHGTVKQV